MIQPTYTFKATITNIVDGDTADADIDVGFHIKMKQRLRFNRINTSEMHSSIAAERELAVAAKQFSSDAILNKAVIITTSKSDAFGRYLAEIYYDKGGIQVNLNDELLENGLAKIFR